MAVVMWWWYVRRGVGLCDVMRCGPMCVCVCVVAGCEVISKTPASKKTYYMKNRHIRTDLVLHIFIGFLKNKFH